MRTKNLNKTSLTIIILIGYIPLLLAKCPLTSEQQAECQKAKIHLTFDDGPNLKTSASKNVLDALNSNNVKATFFINTHQINTGQVSRKYLKNSKIYNEGRLMGGTHNQENRDFVRDLVRDGHKVGLHGFGHFNFQSVLGKSDTKGLSTPLKSNAQKEENIQLATTIIKGLIPKPYIFRLPYGRPFKSNNQLREQMNQNLANEDVKMNWDWNIDTRDWEFNDQYKKSGRPESLKQKFIPKMVEKLCHGGVAVMHDISELTGKTLDSIIKDVKQCGGTFVSYEDVINEFERPDGDAKFKMALTKTTENVEERIGAGSKAFCQSTIPTNTKKLSNAISSHYLEKANTNIGTFSSYEQSIRVINRESSNDKTCISAPLIEQEQILYQVKCFDQQTYEEHYLKNNYTKIASYGDKNVLRNTYEQKLKKGIKCYMTQVTVKGVLYHRLYCEK